MNYFPPFSYILFSPKSGGNLSLPLKLFLVDKNLLLRSLLDRQLSLSLSLVAPVIGRRRRPPPPSVIDRCHRPSPPSVVDPPSIDRHRSSVAPRRRSSAATHHRLSAATVAVVDRRSSATQSVNRHQSSVVSRLHYCCRSSIVNHRSLIVDRPLAIGHRSSSIVAAHRLSSATDCRSPSIVSAHRLPSATGCHNQLIIDAFRLSQLVDCRRLPVATASRSSSDAATSI